MIYTPNIVLFYNQGVGILPDTVTELSSSQIPLRLPSLCTVPVGS